MQLLQTQPDGLHLCLLDDAEVSLLRRAAAQDAWRLQFLRDLYALPLDEASANAVARAARHYPELFRLDEERWMTLAEWAAAVHVGWWRAPGVGPRRLRRIAEALTEAGLMEQPPAN